MKNIYLAPEEEIISIIDKVVEFKGTMMNLVAPPEAQIWQSAVNLKLLKREADNLGKQIVFVVASDLNAEMAGRVGFLVKKEKTLPVELVTEKSEPEAAETKKRDFGLGFPPLENQASDEVRVSIATNNLGEPEQESPKLPNDLEKAGRPLGPDDQNLFNYLVEELKPQGKVKLSSSFSSPGSGGSKVSLLAAKSEAANRRMSDIVNRGGKESKINFFPDLLKGKKEGKKDVSMFHFWPKKSEFKKEFSETSKVQKISNKKEPTGKPMSSKWSKILFGLVALAVVIVLVIGSLVLPSANIVITPKSEKVQFDLKVAGSTKIQEADTTLNRIPMEEMEMTKNKDEEFDATGEQQLNEKATGFITIFNEYSSSPQTLVATTRFESSEGKVFRILENITVPGAQIVETKVVASSIRAKVVADQPGAEYNIGPANFTIPGFKGTPKFSGFYAKSEEAMTSGSIEKIKVVSKEDIEKAQQKVSEELKLEISEALKQEIPAGWKAVDGSIKEELTTISTVKEGDRADKFRIEMKATGSALVFKESDLAVLIEANVAGHISANKTPLPETQVVGWANVEINKTGEVILSLSIEEQVVSYIDQEELKNNLAGQTETEVRRYLAERAEIQEAKVNLWPFWVKKIPSQKKRIKIEVNLSPISS